MFARSQFHARIKNQTKLSTLWIRMAAMFLTMFFFFWITNLRNNWIIQKTILKIHLHQSELVVLF